MASLGGPEGRPAHGRDRDFSMRIKDRLAYIGLSEMSPHDLERHHNLLRGQLALGLSRQGEPTIVDGGVLAIRTRIPTFDAQTWQRVPVGQRVLTGEFGGTNLNVSIAEKLPDGTIVQTILHQESFGMTDRQVTFDEFVDRIAQPLETYRHQAGSGDFNFGLSLGLPHKNSRQSHGMEAVLLPEKDGTLPKGWRILDWDTIPEDERGIIAAINNKLGNSGFGIAINDTPAVALDGEALQAARSEGYDVLPAGAVAGTGTNGAINVGSGLINTEIGHAYWIDNAISRRLRHRLIEQGILMESQDLPEFEHETGQYIARRVAAAIEILGEQEEIQNTVAINIVGERVEIQNAESLAQKIEEESGPDKNPALVSELATGDVLLSQDVSTNNIVREVAQAAQRRAEQMYGILFATLAEPLIDRSNNQPKAILTEGSVIHKGLSDETQTLRYGAENIAESLLHQPLKIYPASGMNGVAAVAMSWNQLR